MDIPKPLTGGELNCIQHLLNLLGGDDDPLKLMNKLTTFKEAPPEFDERWLRKIAACSEMLVAMKRNCDILHATRNIAERLVAEVAAWEAGALDSDSFDSSMLMLAQDAEKALGKEGK